MNDREYAPTINEYNRDKTKHNEESNYCRGWKLFMV